jgi:filamentous hemagglutinin family protein
VALYPILRRTATAAVIGWVCALSFFSPTHAQASPPITSSGLNTIVSPNGNTYNITGGTRAGANLFHSFGEFGVPANNIANFLNETALPTNNILGRVTGNNPSNIFGSITTTDFGNANLFLMNPAGIVFGPNATLNVGGSVTFTTANTIRLANAGIFQADTASTSVLTSAPVEAFGFLGSNSGAITIQGSTLSVEPGHAINLVGGNIAITSAEVAPDTIQPARITAQDGQINIVSVASVGEVLASSFQPSSGMALGSINLGPGTLLDVSGDSAGTVRIRGGQLVVDNAAISADTGESNGAPIAVDIDVTGDLSITSTQSSAITARATGAGNAGEIRLNSAKMDVNFSYPEFGVLIDSSTVGAGNAGKVTVTTGNLTAINTSTGFGVFVDSGTGGTGNGGDVTIKVRNGEFLGTPINTGDAFFFGSGSAGNLYIGGADGMADSLHIDSASLSTEAFSAKAGAITLEGRDITITNNAFVSSISFLGENPITINADQLKMDTVIRVQAQTIGPGNGGDIVFTGKRLEMSNESAFITNTLGDGNAGNIRVNASELVRFTDDPQKSTPSGLFSNSIGTEGVPTSGRAGEIQIITPRLEMIGGARISTTTQTAGRGGDVTITSPEGIFISGQRTEVNPLENFGLGGSDGSGIFTRTISTDQCGGTCGKGGDQVITTGRLVLQSGGTLDSGTTGNGNSGNVEVHASDAIVISGTLVDGSPSGIFSRTIGTASDAGSGGNIALTAGQSVTISDGASVSASSTGPGNAGNIAINAGQQFEMRNSSVKTEAAQASGGNIDIQAIDRIRLVNSSISTSVLGGAGSGGNITIDPNVVILQNSRIIAQAVQGAGGNITITTPLYLPDSTSIVNASSQFGLNGTVNIQSPTSNLAGTISSLPSSLRQVQSLQTGRCAALADSRSSSLIVAGRDILPAEPGGWSPSPFALMGGETDSLAMASPPVAAMIASADAPVSLRRLTPAGFLIQSFAENGLTGCRA